MVVVAPAPTPWDSASVSLYQASDSALGNLPVFIFYGPSTTTNSTLNSSRIQAHIFSLAGYRSYPRLTISPTSPLYAAVKLLSEEKQGDETTRGLVISLFKYFEEMPPTVRRCLTDMAALTSSTTIFEAAHAAKLVSNMVRIDNAATTASQIMSGLSEKHLSWVDVDVKVSGNSAATLKAITSPNGPEDCEASTCGQDTSFVDFLAMLGSPAFLPTSKLRRAPSRPISMSKIKSLSATEVEALQREMMEATETEVTYVNKLRELEQLLGTADIQSSPGAQPGTFPDHDERISTLIRHLREIAQINGEFLRSIVELMDETTSHSNYGQPESATPGRHDITGAEAFAKILLAFVPRFSGPYQEYLKLSAQISHILSGSRELENSVVASAIAQVGEKRLKSWLIEPVQRLPRYSLFIDNMVGLLPASHPAMNKFLRAKDLIADICALDGEENVNALSTRRMRELVSQWPSALSPTGRLVSASDVLELKPPYSHASADEDGLQCILVIFADLLVVLRKLESSMLSSRGLVAEVQRPSHAPSMFDGESNSSQKHLAFVASFSMSEVKITEFNSGQAVFLTSVRKASKSAREPEKSTNYSVITKAFRLQGSYEGKASKLSEDIARARIENRFPESMRDGPAWNFRVLPPEKDHLGLALALFDTSGAQNTSGPIQGCGRIVIAIRDESACRSNPEHDANRTAAGVDFHVSALQGDIFRLEGRTIDGRRFVDQALSAEFIPLILKRVAERLRHDHYQTSFEAAQSHIAFNQKILEGTRPRQRLNSTSSRMRLRPVSPVKALSNFFGSGTKLSQYLIPPPAAGDGPPSPSPIGKQPNVARKENIDDGARGRFTVVDSTDVPVSGSMLQLETTFNTYVVALHCRAGNIVGRALRNREGADELDVNELYNTLIEDPSQHQAAAEVPVDVLFSAFEKFIANEWKDRMGEILPLELLQTMQLTFDRSPHSELSRRIKALLNELSPQNRRVLAATVKLLYDLLEASSNDADRGALTASFTEILFLEGDPHQYISLLDRLVDDVDTFFDDIAPVGGLAPGQSLAPPSSLRRMRSVNTGSISSTGSSLKKRFGFGMLSRENSKNESTMNTVWRTLSKKSSAEADVGSVKGFLSRSKSSERDPSRLAVSRPGSADRPYSAHSMQESPYSAFSSIKSRVQALNQPVECLSTPGPARKPKRRSSLSDLDDVGRHGSPFENNSPLPKRAPQYPRAQGLKHATTAEIAPSRIVVRSASPGKKENVAPTPTLTPSLNSNVQLSGTNQQPVVQARQSSLSKVLRQPLAERPDNQASPPPRTAEPPRTLKNQSPHKIRDRLDRESSAAKATGTQLRAKLLELRGELQDNDSEKCTAPGRRSAEEKLATLERRLAESQHDTNKRLASIQRDLESSLAVSEQKCKKLDKVYQEANVENELLYDRFNSELAKVFLDLKVDGLSAVLDKLKEAQGEISKLKKENYRLKRENIGMRSQLSG